MPADGIRSKYTKKLLFDQIYICIEMNSTLSLSMGQKNILAALALATLSRWWQPMELGHALFLDRLMLKRIHSHLGPHFMRV